MKFGVAHGNAPASRSLEILRAAEDAGFDQFWMFDSHVIWQDCYSVLGWLIGLSRSETMQFGTLVTNPVSRDPSVSYNLSLSCAAIVCRSRSFAATARDGMTGSYPGSWPFFLAFSSCLIGINTD